MGSRVVFKTEPSEQRRAPGRLGMLSQKARQTGEIIRPTALRVAEQRFGERGVLVGARLAPNGDQRYLEHPGMGNLLRGGVGREFQPRLRRGYFGQRAI